MAHDVDGYQLVCTGTNTWQAKLSKDGKLLDVIPTTPDEDRAWFRKVRWPEMEQHLASRKPFVAALYEPKDSIVRREIKRFTGVYEMVATGKRVSDWGIETRIVRHIRSGADHA